MSNAFRELANQKAAPDDGFTLRCSAHGCPQRWSVDPGRLCSYHAWEDPKNWPRITADLRSIGPWELNPKKPVNTTSYPGDNKAWAKRLRDREQAGEHLSKLQRTMFQAVLGGAA